jgi:hypothetical protein
MIDYLINSSICLFVLWLVYKLLLENTSWHQVKRFYLLTAIVVAAVIPMIAVRTVTIPFVAPSSLDFAQFETVSTTNATTGFQWSWSVFLIILYVVGVAIMAVRLIRNLYGLRIKSTDQLEDYKGYKLVLRELVKVPHSFYDRIYASREEYRAARIPETVLDHEKAHLDQRHSFDILLLESLIVLLWFNPLLYLVKYSIKLNHEFLADQAVISHGADATAYQKTLLAYSANQQQRSLVNTFNFPLIKKRFTIMKTRTTTASGLLRSLAIVPVLALLVISCGQEEVIVEPEVIEIV